MNSIRKSVRALSPNYEKRQQETIQVYYEKKMTHEIKPQDPL